MKASKFSTFLKWVGYATAILSLFAGIREIVKLISARVESHRKVDALLSSEDIEIKGLDYRSAWRTLDQASQLEPDSAKVHVAQENLAMAWLEDTHLRENEKFSDVADKLEPILSRGVTSAKDPMRAADLLAHLGWAYFLRSRDGVFGSDPAGVYSKAVGKDPNNPFAQAMWGHWILWNHGRLSDASQHFSSALLSGRERDFVRRLQLSALFNCANDDCSVEIIRVANDIRKEHGLVDADSTNRIFSNYYGRVFSSSPESNRFVTAIPPAEHVATFQWLFDGLDFDESKSLLRLGYLATIQDAAGQRELALANYRTIRSKRSKESGPLFDAADQGIKRLSTAH